MFIKVQTIVGLLLARLDWITSNAYDDTLYFNKSIPEYETYLTQLDFQRARSYRFRTFLSVNEKNFRDDSNVLYNRNRFEGDIAGNLVLNVRQGVAYSGVANINRTWKSKMIPYTISSQYSTYAKSVIASAFEEYERRTCIQFVPRTNEIDYLFIAPDDGCYSMVGRAGGKQTVSLGSGCIKKGVIIHELMHAVGFFHEQSRNDRDLFVDIMWQNIASDMVDQFQKYSLNTVQHLGITYDYASVMHYSSRAFSKNGEETIVPKRTGVYIGQREGFSDLDVLKVNKLYGCDGPQYPPPGAVVDLGQPAVQPVPAPPLQPQPNNVVFPSTNSNNCMDVREDCHFLKSVNYCDKYSDWMRTNCLKTCEFCNYVGTNGNFAIKPTGYGITCEDDNSHCAAWANAGFCENGLAMKDYMHRNCKKSCNVCAKLM